MSLRGGIQLHCQTWKHGLIDHLFIGITLISMCGECGCINYARKVFDEIEQITTLMPPKFKKCFNFCFLCNIAGTVERAKGGGNVELHNLKFQVYT